MLYIGTSGYSYDDWVGPYYPPDLDKREWLAYYAREFKATEVNSTYYRLPTPYLLAALAKKTPAEFVFTVKASQELTHAREENEEAFRKFKDAMNPLLDAGKLGCVLAQFPFSFYATAENRDYLAALRDKMAELPVVIEFRNVGWLKPETYEFLREQNLGFCCVDEPHLKGLIPPVAEVTSNVAYVRFHGRNAQKWWQHENAYERYNYTYKTEELQEWVPKIQELNKQVPQTFVFANNHWQGQAVGTARQLKLLLEGG